MREQQDAAPETISSPDDELDPYGAVMYGSRPQPPPSSLVLELVVSTALVVLWVVVYWIPLWVLRPVNAPPVNVQLPVANRKWQRPVCRKPQFVLKAHKV